MKIIPQADWLLVRPSHDEVKYGDIHLPDTAKARANNGTVLAIGPWCEQVKVGNWVVFSRRQAQDYIAPSGEELLFIRESGILVYAERKDEAASEA